MQDLAEAIVANLKQPTNCFFYKMTLIDGSFTADPIKSVERFFGFVTQPDQDRLNTVVGTYLRDNYGDAEIELFGKAVFLDIQLLNIRATADHVSVLSKLNDLVVGLLGPTVVGQIPVERFHNFIASLSPIEVYRYFTLAETISVKIEKIEMN
jgi:hypothetical protein